MNEVECTRMLPDSSKGVRRIMNCVCKVPSTLVTLILALASMMLSVADVRAVALDFFRLDLELEGVLFARSDWGQVDLRYPADDEVLYFNLNVDGSWQVRDVPLLSHDGPGIDQYQVFSFDLGLAPAPALESILFGYSLTTAPADAMPQLGASATVKARYASIASAFADATIPPVPPTPAPLIGGEAVQGTTDPTNPYANFPNQECDRNACLPTAVSNSLIYLKSRKELKIDDADTTIDTWKRVLRYEPARGVPDSTGWFETKQLYLSRKGVNIETRRILDVSDIVAEIAKGNAVEILTRHHAAAVVGISKLSSGRYTIDVVHDIDQQEVGGTVKETISFDPNTKRFGGGAAYFHGQEFRYAVVQQVAVAEPPALLLVAAALLGLLLIGGAPAAVSRIAQHSVTRRTRVRCSSSRNLAPACGHAPHRSTYAKHARSCTCSRAISAQCSDTVRDVLALPAFVGTPIPIRE